MRGADALLGSEAASRKRIAYPQVAAIGPAQLRQGLLERCCHAGLIFRIVAATAIEHVLAPAARGGFQKIGSPGGTVKPALRELCYS
jgi:hypothetical protein